MFFDTEKVSTTRSNVLQELTEGQLAQVAGGTAPACDPRGGQHHPRHHQPICYRHRHPFDHNHGHHGFGGRY